MREGERNCAPVSDQRIRMVVLSFFFALILRLTHTHTHVFYEPASTVMQADASDTYRSDTIVRLREPVGSSIVRAGGRVKLTQTTPEIQSRVNKSHKAHRYVNVGRSAKKKVQIRYAGIRHRDSLSRYTRVPHSQGPAASQECHRVEEQEWAQYTSRNDTNSNRSKLIIAGKKLINAYDLLVGFCRGVRTIQLKRRFAGLTRQPAERR